MRTFITNIVLLTTVGVALNLYRAHRLLQGDTLRPRTAAEYLTDALIGIALVIWGLMVL